MSIRKKLRYYFFCISIKCIKVLVIHISLTKKISIRNIKFSKKIGMHFERQFRSIIRHFSILNTYCIITNYGLNLPSKLTVEDALARRICSTTVATAVANVMIPVVVGRYRSMYRNTVTTVSLCR